MTNKVKGIVAILLFLILAVSMFIFSGQNGESSSELSHKAAEHICEITVSDFSELPQSEQAALIAGLNHYVRKSAHFAIYCFMGIFSYYAALKLHIRFKYKALLSALLCLAYAATDELHQFFIPDRTFKLTDILIDMTGALFGIGFVKLLSFAVTKIKNKQSYNP